MQILNVFCKIISSYKGFLSLYTEIKEKVIRADFQSLDGLVSTLKTASCNVFADINFKEKFIWRSQPPSLKLYIDDFEIVSCRNEIALCLGRIKRHVNILKVDSIGFKHSPKCFEYILQR